MYYDQLLALRTYLKVILIDVINDRNKPLASKEAYIDEILRKIRYVDTKIKTSKAKYSNCGVSKEEAKQYRKDVKHEFLTQVANGYSVESIVEFIIENYDNPGVNLEKIITSLRNNGYFIYEHPNIEDTKLYLTAKAERYLENEANVSLRR